MSLSSGYKNKGKVSFTASMNCCYPNKVDAILQEKAKINQIKLRCFPISKFNETSRVWQPSKPKNTDQDSVNSDEAEEQTWETAEHQTSNQVLLRHSKFPNRPPTVFFQYPEVCGITNNGGDCRVFPLQGRELRYKINGWQYKCIINSVEFNGFKPS
jgi:hypothetical protein